MVPPSDKFNHWILHEGSGTTAHDDGSGADDGTLDSAVTFNNKTELLAGRLEVIGSSTLWVWHPIAEIPIGIAEKSLVSTVYKKRLWLLPSHASEDVYCHNLPNNYGDIVNDDNRNFLTDTYFETSFHHGDFKSDEKAFYRITATLGHAFDTDIYFECWYKKLL